MKVLATNQWEKEWHERGHEWWIKAIGQLVHLDGNTAPYFSITGELAYQQTHNKRWMEVRAGAIHEDIVLYLPELAPLVKVHLSNDKGVPMHAAANAAYWAGQTMWQKLDLDTLSKHLRVTPEFAQEMVDYAVSLTENKGYAPVSAWNLTFKDFDRYPHWKLDAERAMELLWTLEEAAV